jgi:hypothetical protein
MKRPGNTLWIFLFLMLLSMLQVNSCTRALGVRNPDYNKKIETIAVLNFTGSQRLSAAATATFVQEAKRLNVVGVYMPHQVKTFLAEQGLSDAAPKDSASRAILASKLKIDAFMSGYIVQYENTSRQSGNLELTVRLTDIHSDQQIYSATVRTDHAGILTGEEQELITAAIDSIIDDIKKQFDL